MHRARLPGTSNLRVRLPGFAKPWTRLPGKRNVRTRLPRPQFCKSGPGYLVDQITWSRPKVGQIAWSRSVGPREMAFGITFLAACSPCKDAPSRRARKGRTRCRLDRPSSGAGARSRLGLSAIQAPCALNASLVQVRGRGGPSYRCTPQGLPLLIERALFEAASELPRALRPSESDPAGGARRPSYHCKIDSCNNSCRPSHEGVRARHHAS